MVRRRFSFPVTRSASLALVLGLLATVTLFLWTHHHEQKIEDFNFERRANFCLSAIRQGLDDAVQALRVVNHVFETIDPVSREEFHAFTQPLLGRYPYIQAFSFQRIISRAERPAFEAAMRKRYPGFAVTERVDDKLVAAGLKDSYRVIDYLEPMTGNEAAFGLDASSSQRLNEAVRRADDTGQEAATDLARLMAQGTDPQRGFVILMPVYRHGTAAGSSDARRRTIVGYTVMVVRADDLIEEILTNEELQSLAGFDLSVYAGSEPNERDLAFRMGKGPSVASSISPLRHWLFRDDSDNFARTIDVAGTPWYMVISPQPMPFAASHRGALLTLLAGILSSFLAAAYLQTLAARSRRTQRLVDKRTAELKLANNHLIEDIAARRRAEAALRESQKSLRKLTAYQQQIKESERKRIAREIHDELGQNLLALRLDVAMLHARTDRHPKLHEKVGNALTQIDTTMKAVRGIINDLRPGVLDLGLSAAIEWQVQQFQRRSGIVCELRIEPDEFGLGDDRATALFRILQESLTNILRHAKATRVGIGLFRDGGRLTMKIEDNGVGIVPARRRKANAFGLVGIEERVSALGGRFAIAGNPGQGMTLTVSLPLLAKAHGLIE